MKKTVNSGNKVIVSWDKFQEHQERIRGMIVLTRKSAVVEKCLQTQGQRSLGLQLAQIPEFYIEDWMASSERKRK
jgi:hypothetical protein